MWSLWTVYADGGFYRIKMPFFFMIFAIRFHTCRSILNLLKNAAPPTPITTSKNRNIVHRPTVPRITPRFCCCNTGHGATRDPSRRR